MTRNTMKTLGLISLLALNACDEDTASPRPGADSGTPDGGRDISTPRDAGGRDGGAPAATASDTKLTADAVAKLKSCKLYVPGDEDEVIADEYDRCATRCLLDQSCANLEELRCSDFPNLQNPLFACVAKCPEHPKDGFACSDGSKQPYLAVCDGAEDCDDGEDEQDCPVYTCKDGTEIPLAAPTCDGWEDCEDGSDEADCGNICE